MSAAITSLFYPLLFLACQMATTICLCFNEMKLKEHSTKYYASKHQVLSLTRAAQQVRAWILSSGCLGFNPRSATVCLSHLFYKVDITKLLADRADGKIKQVNVESSQGRAWHRKLPGTLSCRPCCQYDRCLARHSLPGCVILGKLLTSQPFSSLRWGC